VLISIFFNYIGPKKLLKMVQYCCVPQCNSKWKKGTPDKVRFHQFPKEKSLRARWMVAIKTGKEPSKYAKVCGKHFRKEDYVPLSTGE